MFYGLAKMSFHELDCTFNEQFQVGEEDECRLFVKIESQDIVHGCIKILLVNPYLSHVVERLGGDLPRAGGVQYLLKRQ
jgi:hypothetical protein